MKFTFKLKRRLGAKSKATSSRKQMKDNCQKKVKRPLDCRFLIYKVGMMQDLVIKERVCVKHLKQCPDLES
jgi:hypothetical protein